MTPHSDHEARIRYLERVTESLDKHLGEVVDRFAKFERRLIITAVLLFAGSANGTSVAKLVASLFA